jgi:hypothetical protein
VIKRNRDSALAVPSDSRWSLLARACEVEGKNEAILVKLATERDLETEALKALGLFRQAIQKLRESIRDDKEIPFASRGPEYVFFNDLAAKVGSIIISSFREDTSPDRASKCLRDVASVRRRDFDAVVSDFVGNGRSQVLLYDRAAGHADIVGFDDNGAMNLDHGNDGWRTTWNILV